LNSNVIALQNLPRKLDDSGSDGALLETAVAWLEEGYSIALVTVLKTWGSSPRPVGSMMLIREDGLNAGSISGGCVEGDLVERFQNNTLAGSFPALVHYGVNREEAARIGLPCGGQLELLVERLQNASQLKVVLEYLHSSRLVARHVCLRSGEVSLHSAAAEDDFSCNQDRVSRVFGPQWQLLLIGAGHLSRYVARMALMMDYRVVICDPREDSIRGWDIEGVKLASMMPDEAVHAYAAHPRSGVITLTHDPRLDDMALMDALGSEAFYVGALGSKQTSHARRERLETLGISVRDLQHLHAPVGLAIGSHTPAEIAVSILAELTAARSEAKQRVDREAVP